MSLVQVAGHGDIHVDSENPNIIQKPTTLEETEMYKSFQNDPILKQHFAPFLAKYHGSKPRTATNPKYTHEIFLENLCLFGETTHDEASAAENVRKEDPEPVFPCSPLSAASKPQLKSSPLDSPLAAPTPTPTVPIQASLTLARKVRFGEWSSQSIADVKIGFIRHTKSTPRDKVVKDNGSTVLVTGFRVTGMQHARVVCPNAAKRHHHGKKDTPAAQQVKEEDPIIVEAMRRRSSGDIMASFGLHCDPHAAPSRREGKRADPGVGIVLVNNTSDPPSSRIASDDEEATNKHHNQPVDASGSEREEAAATPTSHKSQQANVAEEDITTTTNATTSDDEDWHGASKEDSDEERERSNSHTRLTQLALKQAVDSQASQQQQKTSKRRKRGPSDDGAPTSVSAVVASSRRPDRFQRPFRVVTNKDGSVTEVLWREGKDFGRNLHRDDVPLALAKFCTLMVHDCSSSASTVKTPTQRADFWARHPGGTFTPRPHRPLVESYRNSVVCLINAIDASNIMERYSFSSSSLLFFHQCRLIEVETVAYDSDSTMCSTLSQRSAEATTVETTLEFRCQVKWVDFSSSGPLASGNFFPESTVRFREGLVNLRNALDCVLDDYC